MRGRRALRRWQAGQLRYAPIYRQVTVLHYPYDLHSNTTFILKYKDKYTLS